MRRINFFTLPYSSQLSECGSDAYISRGCGDFCTGPESGWGNKTETDERKGKENVKWQMKLMDAVVKWGKISIIHLTLALRLWTV